MSNKGASPDLVIADIAKQQHGVISAAQLAAIGIDRYAVHHRNRTGRLHRIHQGIYTVGHAALPHEARWMAAVLAYGGRRLECGGLTTRDRDAISETVLEHWGAAVSHRSAAELWKLLAPADGPIDVSVSGEDGKRKRRGIRVHRSPTLLPAHVTLRDAIPVTTPARTIADLRRAASRRSRSGAISAWELRRAIRQAEVLGLTLGDDVETDGTRSDLESEFLALCRRHRLPAPEVNVRVGPHLVDFLWRGSKVVVETDGYEYHRGRQAFQDDRGRGLDLRLRGFQVIQLAEKQVDEEPRWVAEAVAAALRVGADAEGPDDREEGREDDD
jgi:very-short-patch-repair endonuclease/predicted transcriptional regulator of viral defense system